MFVGFLMSDQATSAPSDVPATPVRKRYGLENLGESVVGRTSAVFSLVFVVSYIIFLYANQGPLLLIYYPVINQWSMTVLADSGPGMRWYGFVINSALVAAIAAAAFAAAGPKISTRLFRPLTYIALAATLVAMISQGVNVYEHFFLP